MVGIYLYNVGEECGILVDEIICLVGYLKVVVIGEVGFDYYYDKVLWDV